MVSCNSLPLQMRQCRRGPICWTSLFQLKITRLVRRKSFNRQSIANRAFPLVAETWLGPAHVVPQLPLENMEPIKMSLFSAVFFFIYRQMYSSASSVLDGYMLPANQVHDSISFLVSLVKIDSDDFPGFRWWYLTGFGSFFCLSNFCSNKRPTFFYWCWLKNVRTISIMFSLKPSTPRATHSSLAVSFDHQNDFGKSAIEPIPTSPYTSFFATATYWFRDLLFLSPESSIPISIALCLSSACLIEHDRLSNKSRPANGGLMIPPGCRGDNECFFLVPATLLKWLSSNIDG